MTDDYMNTNEKYISAIKDMVREGRKPSSKLKRYARQRRVYEAYFAPKRSSN